MPVEARGFRLTNDGAGRERRGGDGGDQFFWRGSIYLLYRCFAWLDTSQWCSKLAMYALKPKLSQSTGITKCPRTRGERERERGREKESFDRNGEYFSCTVRVLFLYCVDVAVACRREKTQTQTHTHREREFTRDDILNGACTDVLCYTLSTVHVSSCTVHVLFMYCVTIAIACYALYRCIMLQVAYCTCTTRPTLSRYGQRERERERERERPQSMSHLTHNMF